MGAAQGPRRFAVLQFYVVMLILALVLALGTVFLLVLSRVLDERRAVGDARLEHSIRALHEDRRALRE
jgi:hypothetical protein